MRARIISATTVASIVCWVVGFALVVASFALPNEWGLVGVCVCGLGLMLSVRAFMLQLYRALSGRERNAFDLGRDSSEMRHRSR